MRKISLLFKTSILLIILFCISNSRTYAKDLIYSNFQENYIISNKTNTIIEQLDNGDYIETVISSTPSSNNFSSFVSIFSTSNTITKTKTTYYKNSSGSIMWSVSIKATFTYNGSSSNCVSCSHSTTSPGKTWSIKSCTSYKSKNTATAKAIATHTDSDGSKYDISRIVTISCNANGIVS